MRLLMVNSLIMFDIVFMFFLFLIAVTCIVYYMPGGGRRQSSAVEEVDSDVIPPPPLFDDPEPETIESCRGTYILMPSVENMRTKICGPVHLV